MKKFISVALATLLIAANGTTTAYTAWAHTAMANSSTYLGSATIFATGFTVAGYVAYKQNGPSDLALYGLPIGAIASLAAAKAFSCIPCYNPGAYSPIIGIAALVAAFTIPEAIKDIVENKKKNGKTPINLNKGEPHNRLAPLGQALDFTVRTASLAILPTLAGLGAVHLANSIY